MKKLSHTAALAALILASCQQQAPTNFANNDAATQINAALPPAEQVAVNGANVGAPANQVALTPAKLPTRIPEPFQGRWGLNKADCTSTMGDAKGLLTISDAQLTFYESKGTLDKIITATDTSFAGRFGFSGEGQTWMRTERLSLVNADLRRVTDPEPGQEPPVDLTYQRCSA